MFSRKDALQIHIRKFHADNLLEKQNFDCIHCDCIFTDYTKLIEHISLQYPLPRNQIGGQQTSPLLSETLKKNRSVTSRQRDTISESNSSKPVTQSATKTNDTTSQRHITSRQSALKGSAQNEVIYPRNEEVYDLLLFFANTRSQIKDYLKSRLQQHGIKWYLSAQVEMYMESSEGEIRTDSPHSKDVRKLRKLLEKFFWLEYSKSDQSHNT